MENKYLKLYKKIIIVAGSIFLLTSILMFYHESISPEWKNNQRSYDDFFQTIDTLNGESHLTMGLRQIEIEEFNHTDRCITCHLGIDKIDQKSTTLSFASHPGDMFRSHDLASFGCTLCHVGNGRSLKYNETCNPDYIIDWRPVESSCSKCHLTFYDSSLSTRLPKDIVKGRSLLYKSGCLGCHKLRHVGGRFGPDLTELGDKIRQGYDFKNIQGKKSIFNWHREHFANPEKVSPGTIMPDFSFDPGQIESLTTLVLGFSEPKLPFRYYDLSVLSEFKGERKKLDAESTYTLICSACHEQEGLGRKYEKNIFGVPGLANPDFQAAASLEMISFIIQEGRGSKYMPSWKARHSGLKDDELLQLTERIRNLWRSGQTFAEVRAASYNILEGNQIYLDNCSTCHQNDKSGGIGPSLNSKSFGSFASEKFLFTTLMNGRPNTAMPSWTRFDAEALHSIIRYLQPRAKNVIERQTTEVSNSRIKKGQDIYHYHCSRCHGEEGNGGIGPAILKRGFLKAASDEFIIGIVKTGRGHTPMFAAIQNEGDLQDLIHFMRQRQTFIGEYIHPGPTLGDPGSGKKIFQKLCSDCHGKLGEGIKATALNNQEFLNAATNGYLLATMTMGRENTPMPEWGKTTDEHKALSTKVRHDLAAFIRQWQILTIKRETTDPIYRLLTPEK